MTWQNAIRKQASKKQQLDALDFIIRKYRNEVEEFQYDDARDYYERKFQTLENKDLNDSFSKQRQKEILEFYEKEADLMWEKKTLLIPNLKSLRDFIDEFDTEE